MYILLTVLRADQALFFTQELDTFSFTTSALYTTFLDMIRVKSYVFNPECKLQIIIAIFDLYHIIIVLYQYLTNLSFYINNPDICTTIDMNIRINIMHK